ncbi:MAG: quinone-dependent dihydroorotate dehydrogenase [Bacteriovoracaceae bacterium]
MLYSLVKPILFSLQPEVAHDFILKMAKLGPFLGQLSGFIPDERLKIDVGSSEWKFPIGLAAGLDKNADALDFFSAQGFGAIECGTITLRPQLGNPRPRMFRYPDKQSLRNAMGFPNDGLLEIIPRLQRFEGKTPIGANIGKNKDSTPEESIEELALLFESLAGSADYFVVNVSSPNTPGLRALQERSYLSELFSILNEARKTSPKDVYLKIAPDLETNKIIELTHLAHEFHLTGLIATNTTIMPELGVGGVSGLMLKNKARMVRQTILNEKLPIELISVGGISDSKDLFDLWMDGGKAAQIYTAYIYQGPTLLKSIQVDILRFLKNSGLENLNSLFNLDNKLRRELLQNYTG